MAPYSGCSKVMPQRVSPALVWKNFACSSQSAMVAGQPRSLPVADLNSARACGFSTMSLRNTSMMAVMYLTIEAKYLTALMPWGVLMRGFMSLSNSRPPKYAGK